MIRCPVDGVSIVGRSTQGVRIFNTGEGERVVSVRSIPDYGNGNGNGDGPEAATDGIDPEGGDGDAPEPGPDAAPDNGES
jgi:DNA gyrase subunit A